MKKLAKYTLAVLAVAWTGALTIFVGVVMLVGLSALMETLFNNNIFMCVFGAICLALVTWGASAAVRDKLKKWRDADG